VGDEYSRVDFCPEIIKVKGVNREQLHLEVKARNTTKYPPESATYDIVGIPDEYWWNAVGELGELPLDWFTNPKSKPSTNNQLVRRESGGGQCVCDGNAQAS